MNQELYHHGVKGQKWGFRRYQNPDGSLTEVGKKRLAKTLKKEHERNYSRYKRYNITKKYRQTVEEAVERGISNNDKKRIIEAKRRWDVAAKKAIDAENEICRLKEKEPANNKTSEKIQELIKILDDSDKVYDSFVSECKNVCDIILGEYGDVKLKSDLFASVTIKDTVGEIVETLMFTKWDP